METTTMTNEEVLRLCADLQQQVNELRHNQTKLEGTIKNLRKELRQLQTESFNK